jgi:hypothetical protein
MLLKPNYISKIGLSLLLFTGLCHTVSAQDLLLNGFNPNYYQTGTLLGKLSYNLNISSISSLPETVNNKEFVGGRLHLVGQIMPIQKVAKGTSIGLGYGYGFHNIFGIKETENRYLGQTSFQHNFGKLSVNHRLRYEYRTPVNQNTGIADNASILRYQTFLTFPLYNPKERKTGFYLSASNEAFWYLKGATNGPVSSRNGYFPVMNTSEDWVHLAGGYNAGKARVELGYCFQSLIRNKQLDMRYLSLAQVSVFVNLNWDDVQSWWYL